MGIYIYTLRNKLVQAIAYDGNSENVTVGVSEYAYKEFWSDDSAGYRRRVSRSWTNAEKARRNNPSVALVVMGDPREHFRTSTLPMYVYNVGNDYTGHADGKSPGPVIGQLVKTGRKIHFQRYQDKEVIPMSITN